MSVFAHDQKAGQPADVRSELFAACAGLDSADIDWDSLPSSQAMPNLDPDAWVTGSGPGWLGFCHIDSLTNTVDYVQTLDPVHVKYSFPPVVMERGAQRLDLAMAGSRQPDAAQLILRRAEAHGRWFADLYDAWAGDEASWGR